MFFLVVLFFTISKEEGEGPFGNIPFPILMDPEGMNFEEKRHKIFMKFLSFPLYLFQRCCSTQFHQLAQLLQGHIKAPG